MPKNETNRTAALALMGLALAVLIPFPIEVRRRGVARGTVQRMPACVAHMAGSTHL